MHYSYEKFDSSHKGSRFLRDNLDSFTNLIKSIIILINLIKRYGGLRINLPHWHRDWVMIRDLIFLEAPLAK